MPISDGFIALWSSRIVAGDRLQEESPRAGASLFLREFLAGMSFFFCFPRADSAMSGMMAALPKMPCSFKIVNRARHTSLGIDARRRLALLVMRKHRGGKWIISNWPFRMPLQDPAQNLEPATLNPLSSRRPVPRLDE